MDHSSLVGVLHRIADLAKEGESMIEFGRIDRPSSSVEIAIQSLPADQFHGEEVVAVVGAAGLVDGADVRVLEPGQGLGLTLEHLDVVVVYEMTAADDLERDQSTRARLFGLVDNPHSAFAENAEDAIVADGLRRRRAARSRTVRQPGGPLAVVV